MDEIASIAGSDVDEEIGLTTKERQQRLRRKSRSDELDMQAQGERPGLTAEAKRRADKHVVQKLLINLLLIGLWYLFSLSISIVSTNNPGVHSPLHI